jgi:hypothetical protein
VADDLDELIEGEGFSDEERKEIRERAVEPPEPAPESEEPAPVEPGEREDPARETKADEPETAEEPDKPQKPDLVKRIDAEKAKRKAVEKELADLRSRWEQTEKRISELTAPNPEPEPEKPAIPDPDVDPWGHVAARIGTTEKTLENAIAMIEQQRKEADEQRQYQSFVQRWNSELQEYQRAAKPDVLDAINALKQHRVRELTLLGANDGQIQNALASEELGIVQAAHNAGKNPAELFYELATMRGYSPKQEVKQDDTEADLRRISDGQKKVASSVASGGADIRGLTLEKILDMPQSEYEDLVMGKFGGSYDKMLAKLRQ